MSPKWRQPYSSTTLALVRERVGAFDRLSDEGDVRGVRIARLREQVRDGAGRGRPGWIDDGNERRAPPVERDVRDAVVAEREGEHVRALFAALQFMAVRILARPQRVTHSFRVGGQLLRAVLPELPRGQGDRAGRCLQMRGVASLAAR